ncbi:hypothetical protein GCM10009761_22220 [Agromyces terreus]
MSRTPESQMSSPVFTTTVTDAAVSPSGQRLAHSSRTPRTKRDPPTPPASTVIRTPQRYRPWPCGPPRHRSLFTAAPITFQEGVWATRAVFGRAPSRMPADPTPPPEK